MNPYPYTLIFFVVKIFAVRDFTRPEPVLGRKQQPTSQTKESNRIKSDAQIGILSTKDIGRTDNDSLVSSKALDHIIIVDGKRENSPFRNGLFHISI